MAITTQFCTGFEHDFAGTGTAGLAGIIKGAGLWDAGPTSGTEWAIVTATPTPRHGTYCAQLVRPANTAKFLTKNVTGSATKVVLRLGVMLSARPSSGTPIIMYGGASGATFNLTASSTGVLTLQAGTGTGQSAAAIDTSSWHLLEMQIDVHANPWTIDWKLDGVAQTQATNAVAATTLATISLGTYVASTQAGYTCNYDDFIFGTYTGASPSSTEWYGDGKTLAQFAGSDGTHVDVTRFAAQEAGTAYAGTITNAWSNLTAAGWTDTRSTTKCVSMAAAYVSGATPYMEFAPTTTSETGSANAVYAVLNQSAGSTTSNLCGSIIVNSGGTATTLWGALTPVGSMADWSEITCFFRAAVVTAPVAGWTATEVNALRWRFGGVSNDVSPRPEVQGLMLEVDWPVSAIINITITAVEASSTSSAPVPTTITATQNPTITATPALDVASAPVPVLVNARAPPSAGAISTAPVPTVVATQNPTITAVSAGATSAAPVSTVMVTVTAVSAGSTSTSSTPTVSVTLAAVSASGTSAAPAPSLASSPTITAVAASASSAAPAPTVTATQNPTITAVSAGSTSASPAPTVSLGQSVTITAVSASSTSAAPISTVAATQNPTITAVSAGSTSTAPVPTVVPSQNVTIAGGPLTYALVGTAGVENTTGVTGGDLNNLAWGTGENRTLNNLLILAVQCYGTATLPSAPSGWSISAQQAGTLCSASIFHKIAAGGDAVPTVTGVTGGVLNGNLTEFSGNATISPVDQINSSASASSPVVVTMPGTDATSGELTLCTNTSAYSPAAAINPISLTCNNGSTHGLAQNPGSTATNHYATFYTITTSNSAADAWTYTPNTITNLTGEATVIVSFTRGVSGISSGTTSSAPVPALRIDETEVAVSAGSTSTAPAPTVLATQNITITAVAASATSTAPVPTTRTDANITAVSAGSTSTASAPTVASTQNPTITAVAASGSASAPIPTVVAVQNVTLSAVAAGATSNAPVPTVASTQNVTITAVTASATATAPIFTLETDEADTVPSAGVLATAPAPTVLVTQNPTITAVSAGAITTAPVPTVSATQNVTITAVSASATATSPSIVIGTVISLDANPANATADGRVPTTSTSTTVSNASATASSLADASVDSPAPFCASSASSTAPTTSVASSAPQGAATASTSASSTSASAIPNGNATATAYPPTITIVSNATNVDVNAATAQATAQSSTRRSSDAPWTQAQATTNVSTTIKVIVPPAIAQADAWMPTFGGIRSPQVIPGGDISRNVVGHIAENRGFRTRVEPLGSLGRAVTGYIERSRS